ncbi:hypothetical protein PABG_05510 [Paracoccidioides brasiliensis Pb03]|nr:hypothetical protein PABG_05510 [Paracoccidioides brasiliensis Pb03]
MRKASLQTCHGQDYTLLLRVVYQRDRCALIPRPIIENIAANLEPFATFKHFSLTRKLVMGLPSWVSIRVSPKTSGLVHLQQILGKQVVHICKNPKLLDDTTHKIMKHKLLRPEANEERPGVLSTLLRIDLPLGAIISSAFIPGGDAIDMQIIASMSGTLVHDAETIFLYANPFQPRSLA